MWWLLILIIGFLLIAFFLLIILLNAFVNRDTNYKSFYTKFAALYDNADTQSEDFDGPIIIALLGSGNKEIQSNSLKAKVGDEVVFDVSASKAVMNICLKDTDKPIGYIFVALSGFIFKVSNNTENYIGKVKNYYYINGKKEIEIEISRRA